MSEIGHSQTGIDIHPGAKISYPFFIDHGTGIVIGQTATIGQRVKIYQSVTLGAISLSHAERLREVIRHPQVGNDVTIYAGASILGAIKIGNNVTIGSNVFDRRCAGQHQSHYWKATANLYQQITIILHLIL